MPIMWQLADLARWLDPVIKVYTVVHNPKAAPNTEERGIIRALSQVSHGMVVMTWYLPPRLPSCCSGKRSTYAMTL